MIFIGTGEHIDDFEPFKVQPFVSKLLGEFLISNNISCSVSFWRISLCKKIFAMKNFLKKVSNSSVKLGSCPVLFAHDGISTEHSIFKFSQIMKLVVQISFSASWIFGTAFPLPASNAVST